MTVIWLIEWLRAKTGTGADDMATQTTAPAQPIETERSPLRAPDRRPAVIAALAEEPEHFNDLMIGTVFAETYQR